jgi:4-hydroxybenzoyl-CoA thioesterase
MLTISRTIQIEWGQCDPAQIVFYPRYFEIFDAAAARLFEEAAGMTKFRMLEAYNSAGIPLVATHGRFLKPLRFGDEVVLETCPTEIKRSSVAIRHRLIKDGEVAVEGTETRVWVVRDPAGGLKSHALPTDLAERLAAGSPTSA